MTDPKLLEGQSKMEVWSGFDNPCHLTSGREEDDDNNNNNNNNNNNSNNNNNNNNNDDDDDDDDNHDDNMETQGLNLLNFQQLLCRLKAFREPNEKRRLCGGLAEGGRSTISIVPWWKPSVVLMNSNYYCIVQRKGVRCNVAPLKSC